MTAAKVTRELVFAACDKLFAENQPVTTPRVFKVLGEIGSWQTINKYIKEWKELEDNAAPIKDYPIPDLIKKQYDSAAQQHWNSILRYYEPLIESEAINELQKEVELLRDKNKLLERDSILLEELRQVRKEESQRYEKLVEQQREDAVTIERLEMQLREFTSNY